MTTLSPREVYDLALRAEQSTNEDFYIRIRGIYEEAKQDRFPAGKDTVTIEFRNNVTHLIGTGKSLREAILEAHVALTQKHGVVTLDPSAATFDTQYDRFYSTLSVAIPDTQLEPKEDLKELLRAGHAGKDGKKELGILATCPLTDEPIFATNFYVQPHVNMAWFIYGGVNPTTRGWGHLEGLMGAMEKKTAEEAQAVAAAGGAAVTTRPIIALEMDNPTAMSTKDHLFDVTRREEAPAAGETIEPIGAIDAHLRGAKYAGRNGDNAKVLGALYRQPSLSGKITEDDVNTIMGDATAGALVVRYLADELTVKAEKDRAKAFLEQVGEHRREKAIGEAADALMAADTTLDRAAAITKATEDDSTDLGSTILRLVLVTKDAHIEKARAVELIKHFFADSVLKTGDIRDVEEDIYFKAMMKSIAAIPGDRIELKKIADVLVMPPAANLKEMQQLVPTVLKTMGWDDINSERGEKPLGELLVDEPHLLTAFTGNLIKSRARNANGAVMAALENTRPDVHLVSTMISQLSMIRLGITTADAQATGDAALLTSLSALDAQIKGLESVRDLPEISQIAARVQAAAAFQSQFGGKAGNATLNAGINARVAQRAAERSIEAARYASAILHHTAG